MRWRMLYEVDEERGEDNVAGTACEMGDLVDRVSESMLLYLCFCFLCMMIFTSRLFSVLSFLFLEGVPCKVHVHYDCGS